MSHVFQDCLTLTPEAQESSADKGDSTEDPKRLSEQFLIVYDFVSRTIN